MTSDEFERSTRESTSPPAGSPAHALNQTIEGAVKKPAANANFRSVMMACAGASLLASVSLKVSGNFEDAVFVGQWVPTFLLIALWTAVVREDVAPAS